MSPGNNSRLSPKLFAKKLVIFGLILAFPGLAGAANSQSNNTALSSAFLVNLAGEDIGGAEIAMSGDALLPQAGVIGTSADIAGTAIESDQISIYVVREGDTLSEIAEMYNVSVNTIVWANDLARDAALQTGQTLTILPINGIRHQVAKGETLASIAKKFGGDEKEIIQFNDLAPGATLALGQELMIPGGEEPASTKALAGKPGARGQTKDGRTPYLGGGGPDYPGYYHSPLANYTKTQGLHGYNGVDLAAPLRSPVLAAAAGVVIVSRSSGWNGGYGDYVVIRHGNGTQTLYGHLNDVTVAVGQSVAQGQLVGHLGSTGNSTGPHVHFEIRGAKNKF